MHGKIHLVYIENLVLMSKIALERMNYYFLYNIDDMVRETVNRL